MPECYAEGMLELSKALECRGLWYAMAVRSVSPLKRVLNIVYEQLSEAIVWREWATLTLPLFE